MKVETQMRELRGLLKPLAALGKTLNPRERREMQSGIRSLVEWALETRGAEDDHNEDLLNLRFAAPGPGHRQGFSFIHVPPNVQPRVPIRTNLGAFNKSELEIENKAIVYDFRTENKLRKVIEMMDVPSVHGNNQVSLPPLPPSDMNQSERIRELEHENAALREKVFALIKTLSIENEKSRARINNLQVGIGAKDVDYENSGRK